MRAVLPIRNSIACLISTIKKAVRTNCIGGIRNLVEAAVGNGKNKKVNQILSFLLILVIFSPPKTNGENYRG